MTNAAAISAQREKNRQWYLRHCERPFVHGPWQHAYAGERLVYEAKSAIRAQNPAFAAAILPKTGLATTGYPGLVIRPTGIVSEIDKLTPGSVTVSIDVAGSLTIAVRDPANTIQNPTPAATATRNTFSFDAFLDGLYEVSASLGGALVATFLIAVQREAEYRLAEDSRTNDGGFQFKPNGRPQSSEVFDTRLFLILGKHAAAETSQRELFAKLDAAERALPSRVLPRPLFPAHA